MVAETEFTVRTEVPPETPFTIIHFMVFAYLLFVMGQLCFAVWYNSRKKAAHVEE